VNAVSELEGFRRVFQDKSGSELMIWTSGGHYFRGDLQEISEDGLLVLGNVSCTLAGERHERDVVYISIARIDVIS
jgi:small nuclear ribonucleoprotein (snRNP)-like protein